MENSVEIEQKQGGIIIITLNRRNQRNAVDPPTGQKLYEAFRAFEDNPELKICVFHGANGTFCAGFDLKYLSQQSKTESPDQQSHLLPVAERNRGPMGPSRLIMRKPVICAISGFAVAGGLELSLLGDVRIVEEDAIFGVFCRRFGVPLIDGGTIRLRAIVGLGRALDMILTGRPVDAKEALSMGLANRVVPKGQALKEAIRMAESLLQFPQDCMNTDRMSCYHATYDAPSFEKALDFEFSNGIKVISRESVSGAQRFASGKGRHGSYKM